MKGIKDVYLHDVMFSQVLAYNISNGALLNLKINELFLLLSIIYDYDFEFRVFKFVLLS